MRAAGYPKISSGQLLLAIIPESLRATTAHIGNGA